MEVIHKNNKKILLVEDNVHIMKINSDTLKEAGYFVIEARNIAEAEKAIKGQGADLIVLDIMLPDGDGVEFCQKLRVGSDLPVLFLSAKNQDIDIINGLKKGGDDYLSKPYNLEILVARIENLLKRAEKTENTSTKKTYGELVLDTVGLKCFIRGELINLTPKEFTILLLLAENNGKPIRKETLYQEVWNQPIEQDSRAFWTTISRLKKKLASYEDCLSLETDKYIGYKLMTCNKK